MLGRKKRQAERLTRKQETSRQRILFLMGKAEKRRLTRDEIDEFNRFSQDDYKALTNSERSRFQPALDIARAMSYHDGDRRKLEDAIEYLDRAKNLDQRVYALASLIVAYGEVNPLNRPLLEREFNHNPDGLLAKLKQFVQRRHQELLAVWTDGSAQLEALDRFIDETHSKSSFGSRYPGRLKAVGIDPLPYPKDWNTHVARLYATPKLDQFITRGLNLNEVLLMAEETRRMGDKEEVFTNAQFVLAYCREYPEYRLHVGDILVTELAQVVNDYRTQGADAAIKDPSTSREVE